MSALTTTTVVPHPVQTFYDRALLMRALPALVHDMVAQKRSIKRRSGDIIKFRRYESLPLATVPLVEGQPPAGKELTFTDVVSQLKQYGDYVPLTDYIQLTIQDDILRETNKILGEQGGQTIDAILRDVAAAGTTVLYGGGVAGRANVLGVAHKIDTSILDRTIRTLGMNNAKKFTRMIGAGSKEATFPIRDAYWAITSPEVMFTLETLPGFKSVEEYGSEGRVRNEYGAYKNVRFLCTTHAKRWLGGGGSASGDVKATGGLADVHTVLVFGQEAIATVPIDGGNIQNIINPLGNSGAADPLRQRATSGWKTTRTQAILNDNFMARIEVSVGDVNP